MSYMRNADRAAVASNGVKHIMARLTAGYMQKGGHQNAAYMEADKRMLETYLKREGNK